LQFARVFLANVEPGRPEQARKLLRVGADTDSRPGAVWICAAGRGGGWPTLRIVAALPVPLVCTPVPPPQAASSRVITSTA
jgi:hypothetical protein